MNTLFDVLRSYTASAWDDDFVSKWVHVLEGKGINTIDDFTSFVKSDDFDSKIQNFTIAFRHNLRRARKALLPDPLYSLLKLYADANVTTGEILDWMRLLEDVDIKTTSDLRVLLYTVSSDVELKNELNRRYQNNNLKFPNDLFNIMMKLKRYEKL